MSEAWSETQLTRDAFLDGRLTLTQPQKGYRAGIDPVLLAASVPIKAGQSLLDLGCGVGAAMLCCAVRVPGSQITGLERQPDYAVLAERNAAENGIEAEVFCGDLKEMPNELRQRQFDHVIANPPYFDRSAGTTARDMGREASMGEETPLTDWVAVATKRTKPKGYVTLIHRAARLQTLLTAMAAGLGSLEVLPLIPRRGHSAKLVLVRGQKDGRAELRLYDGWLLHVGPAHEGDRESYTPDAAAVLRHGRALRFSE